MKKKTYENMEEATIKQQWPMRRLNKYAHITVTNEVLFKFVQMNSTSENNGRAVCRGVQVEKHCATQLFLFS
jgi:hypothetical protein